MRPLAEFPRPERSAGRYVIAHIDDVIADIAPDETLAKALTIAKVALRIAEK